VTSPWPLDLALNVTTRAKGILGAVNYELVCKSKTKPGPKLETVTAMLVCGYETAEAARMLGVSRQMVSVAVGRLRAHGIPVHESKVGRPLSRPRCPHCGSVLKQSIALSQPGEE